MATAAKVIVTHWSVPLHDVSCFERLSSGGNEVVIASPYYQVMADLAESPNSATQYLAKSAEQALDEFGKLTGEKGASTKSGGWIRSESGTVKNPKKRLPIGFNIEQPDNQLLAVCLFLMDREKTKPPASRRKVVLVTKDISLRHRAEHCGIHAEDYKSGKIDDLSATIYGSVAALTLETDETDVLNLSWRHGQVSFSELRGVRHGALEALYENQCVFLHTPNGRHVGQAICKQRHQLLQFVKPHHKYDESKDSVVPRNEMQAFAMALLQDVSIPIVTLVGIAGSGKTLLALNWALDNVEGHTHGPGKYQRILVFRSNSEAGKSLGYLPGKIQQKFTDVQREPIDTAIDFISRKRVKEKGDGTRSRDRAGENSTVAYLQRTGLLEIKPPNFSRGATYNDSIIIIDDAQNWEEELLQLIITRAGDNSRVVITGDPTQIDNPRLDAADCGVVKAVHNFRGDPLCASIYLQHSERSKIAELAAKLLGSRHHAGFWERRVSNHVMSLARK